ncbi:chromophore lyase CRL, chloroplastic-like [Amaranthus tricolor]|uniref:chromophore lyase CRL, chloroplastic-like n=1 Tax=Amaranthus tricolor TaxID=29722 RepID=UPI002582C6BF|nr:chromophore lyase CRL, chloroplastic-like [Amaranthus tricolor]XP_057530043.1 chromophore lyase CRL, chloroplastic-like [Amaranthus tricolor]
MLITLLDIALLEFADGDSPMLLIVGIVLQRFYMVKPCSKEMKCDVELSTYAIRDMEEYKNFCDRPKDQRPLPEEVIREHAEMLISMKWYGRFKIISMVLEL